MEPRDRAPYLAEKYDGGPFLTYPERSRFFELYKLFLRNGKLSAYPLPGNCYHFLAELEIFAQTWCLFGLLHEVFGSTANLENFIVTTNGVRIVSTACLSDVIESWLRSDVPAIENMEHWAMQRLECISTVGHFLLGMVARMIIYDKSVMSTIACLAETLSMVVKHTAKAKQVDAAFILLRKPFGYLDTLMNNGWNSGTIGSLEQGGIEGLCTFFYATKIVLGTQTTRPSLSEGGRTSTCEDCGSSGCSLSAVNVDKLHEIIESNGVALLNLTHFLLAPSKEVVLVACEPGMRYIANSHVWSEGMGSPESAVLASCHLRYAAQMARTILPVLNSEDQPLLLWLDNLCWPVLCDSRCSIPRLNLRSMREW